MPIPEEVNSREATWVETKMLLRHLYARWDEKKPIVALLFIRKKVAQRFFECLILHSLIGDICFGDS